MALQPKDIMPTLLNGFTCNGRIFGMPKDFNTLTVLYNKGMFDIANVSYPDKKDGKTDLLSKGFRDAFNWYTELAKRAISIMPTDIGQG